MGDTLEDNMFHCSPPVPGEAGVKKTVTPQTGCQVMYGQNLHEENDPENEL